MSKTYMIYLWNFNLDFIIFIFHFQNTFVIYFFHISDSLKTSTFYFKTSTFCFKTSTFSPFWQVFLKIYLAIVDTILVTICRKVQNGHRRVCASFSFNHHIWCWENAFFSKNVSRILRHFDAFWFFFFILKLESR